MMLKVMFVVIFPFRQSIAVDIRNGWQPGCKCFSTTPHAICNQLYRWKYKAWQGSTSTSTHSSKSDSFCPPKKSFTIKNKLMEINLEN